MRQSLTAALVALIVVAGSSRSALAEVKGLGDPGQLQALKVDTGRTQDGGFRLAGRDAFQQLLVTGEYSSGQLRDLTRVVKYQAAPEDVVAIDATGMVTPVKEGQATIAIQSRTGRAPASR